MKSLFVKCSNHWIKRKQKNSNLQYSNQIWSGGKKWNNHYQHHPPNITTKRQQHCQQYTPVTLRRTLCVTHTIITNRAYTSKSLWWHWAKRHIQSEAYKTQHKRNVPSHLVIHSDILGAASDLLLHYRIKIVDYSCSFRLSGYTLSAWTSHCLSASTCLVRIQPW